MEPLSDLRREVFRTRPTLKMTRRMNELECAVEGEVLVEGGDSTTASTATTAASTTMVIAMEEDNE